MAEVKRKKINIKPRDRNFYAVAWRNCWYGAEKGEFLVINPIFDCDNRIVRNEQGIEINSVAIFRHKCDAESYRDGNKDWITIKILLKKLVANL